MIKDERLELNAVNMMALKHEKLHWNRLHEKMGKYLEKIKPLEEKIFEIQKLREPILDDIDFLRIEMVDFCVHPKDLLIHKGDHILCKFCNKKLSIPTIKRTPDGIKKIEDL
jgi:hypothetical protein